MMKFGTGSSLQNNTWNMYYAVIFVHNHHVVIPCTVINCKKDCKLFNFSFNQLKDFINNSVMLYLYFNSNYK